MLGIWSLGFGIYNMLTVIQRVTKGQVLVENKTVGSIGPGLVVLLGIKKGDIIESVDYLVEKIINLRIFGDENDKMNKSLIDIKGEILLVSQFTLYGNCVKGRRPSFENAEDPKRAKELYELFIQKLKEKNISVQTGEFGAMMQVEIHNDGPVTFVLEK